jgi:hypothetical protein
MSPQEPNDVKKIALLYALNRAPNSADVILDSTIINMFLGKVITLRLDVTNFLGKSGSALVDFTFATGEGLMLQNVMEEYVINPQKDF